jgi:hypothetical protein
MSFILKKCSVTEHYYVQYFNNAIIIILVAVLF